MVMALIGLSCGALHAVYNEDGGGGVDADQESTHGPAAMIVLGGWNTASGELADGSLYSPETDSWSSPPGLSSGLAGGRSYHSAVWTGFSLIIWGGSSGFRYFNDGAVYNPEADTWTVPPGLIASPLRPRRNHVALWTGSTMIVWGGYGDTEGDLNDGAIYSFEDDSWTTPRGLNAGPLAVRRSAGAVWTGREMILWGGTAYIDEDDSWVTYSDGAVYAPHDDSWSQPRGLSNGSSRPSARFTPTAVWTETEMILWGGWDTMSASDGAMYDPVADSWRRALGLEVGSSPLAARSYPEAVWTGTEVIIWGGNDEGVMFGDGAVYDPADDSWRSPVGLGTGGAPSPRRGHSATWTY